MQKQVDNAETFPVVLQKFSQWISSHELGKEGREFAIVTDGPWDMGRFLYGQCMVIQILEKKKQNTSTLHFFTYQPKNLSFIKFCIYTKYPFEISSGSS